MDRISALRNIESALRAFEEGERDLQSVESQTRAVLRTYATDFETDSPTPKQAYRALAPESVAWTIVVATDTTTACERVAALSEAEILRTDIDMVQI